MFNEILDIIPEEIKNWHEQALLRPSDYEILTDDIRRIRTLNEHRQDLYEVVRELVNINTEMWHQQDRFRSKNDSVVLDAIRIFSPLNQHRNDLIEEIDQIIRSMIVFSADNIAAQIERSITEWHQENKNRPADYEIHIPARRELNHHRANLLEVVDDLTRTNTEMWHEEDKVRTAGDEAVVRAVRNMNPMNVHRSECVEEIDEIILEQAEKEKLS